MYKARYYKADGKKGKARDLPGWLFDGVVNEGVLHQVVKAYRANQRQGSGSAKNRSAVRGGGRKPWRQKGTGRARAGTIRSPLWEGGGVAFPPIPGSWRQKLPRKLKALARRSALNSRAADDRVILIDALDFEEPKTRNLVGFLRDIEVDGKVLLLTDGLKRNVYLSGRNVQGLEIRPLGEESAYDVLVAGTVVIEKDALDNGGAAEPGARKVEQAGEPEPKAEKAEPKAAEVPVQEPPAEAVAEVEVEEAEEAEKAEGAAEEEVHDQPEAEATEEPVVETATEEPVVETEEDEGEWPRAGGGGWWTLSSGKKVQGEEKAREAQAALDAEDDDEDKEKGDA